MASSHGLAVFAAQKAGINGLPEKAATTPEPRARAFRQTNAIRPYSCGPLTLVGSKTQLQTRGCSLKLPENLPGSPRSTDESNGDIMKVYQVNGDRSTDDVNPVVSMKSASLNKVVGSDGPSLLQVNGIAEETESDDLESIVSSTISSIASIAERRVSVTNQAKGSNIFRSKGEEQVHISDRIPENKGAAAARINGDGVSVLQTISGNVKADASGSTAGSSSTIGCAEKYTEIKSTNLGPATAEDGSEVLHIKYFLKGKNILITGSTGFLAKVLVEKILRVQPDIGSLYLLIQPRSDKTVDARLAEIIASDLFIRLKEKYRGGYEQFMRERISPISGNIAVPGLGVSQATLDMIGGVIDVIVNSAATTTFDERYDTALKVNTFGPWRLLEFARQCKRVPLFLHVSTAYVNGKRKGSSLEKPFQFGESLAAQIAQYDVKDEVGPEITVFNRVKNFPQLDPEVEMRLAEEMVVEVTRECGAKDTEKVIKEKMVEFGLQRAEMYGWQDTYVFTKAMGEQMVMREKGNIPVAIIRPSVVESTLQEPVPGWMEGTRMLDPIVIAYGKGQMNGFLVDPETILDVIPADVVVNTILAAMTKHAGHPQRHPFVYQVASSSSNPLRMNTIAQTCFDHFTRHPMLDKHNKAIQVGHMNLYKKDYEYRIYLWWNYKLPYMMTALPWLKNKSRASLEMQFRRLSHMAKIYKPYVFYEGRFDATNSEKLLTQVSSEEKAIFSYSVRNVNWYNYLNDIHIPGLRQHVLKWRGTPDKSRFTGYWKGMGSVVGERRTTVED